MWVILAFIAAFLFMFVIGVIRIFDYECVSIDEVLRCGDSECRVLLDNGQRATVPNIVAPSDVVKYWADHGHAELHRGDCK